MFHGEDNEYNSGLKVLIPGIIYLALFFIVYLLTTAAHQGYKAKQDEKIRDYLTKILGEEAQNSGVWAALEKLGTTMVEPDAFEILSTKQGKRVEYLKLVARLTGVANKPSVDQSELLVGRGLVRFFARLGYFVSFVFGLASSLYFFSVR